MPTTAMMFSQEDHFGKIRLDENCHLLYLKTKLFDHRQKSLLLDFT